MKVHGGPQPHTARANIHRWSLVVQPRHGIVFLHLRVKRGHAAPTVAFAALGGTA